MRLLEIVRAAAKDYVLAKRGGESKDFQPDRGKSARLVRSFPPSEAFKIRTRPLLRYGSTSSITLVEQKFRDDSAKTIVRKNFIKAPKRIISNPAVKFEKEDCDCSNAGISVEDFIKQASINVFIPKEITDDASFYQSSTFHLEIEAIELGRS